jgi:hypothetical protein
MLRDTKQRKQMPSINVESTLRTGNIMQNMHFFGVRVRIELERIIQIGEPLDCRTGERSMRAIIVLLVLILRCRKMEVMICMTLAGIDGSFRQLRAELLLLSSTSRVSPKRQRKRAILLRRRRPGAHSARSRKRGVIWGKQVFLARDVERRTISVRVVTHRVPPKSNPKRRPEWQMSRGKDVPLNDWAKEHQHQPALLPQSGYLTMVIFQAQRRNSRA